MDIHSELQKLAGDVEKAWLAPDLWPLQPMELLRAGGLLQIVHSEWEAHRMTALHTYSEVKDRLTDRYSAKPVWTEFDLRSARARFVEVRRAGAALRTGTLSELVKSSKVIADRSAVMLAFEEPAILRQTGVHPGLLRKRLYGEITDLAPLGELLAVTQVAMERMLLLSRWAELWSSPAQSSLANAAAVEKQHAQAIASKAVVIDRLRTLRARSGVSTNFNWRGAWPDEGFWPA